MSGHIIRCDEVTSIVFRYISTIARIATAFSWCEGFKRIGWLMVVGSLLKNVFEELAAIVDVAQ